MVISDYPATRIFLEVPANAEISSLSIKDCIVANIFDSSGNLAAKPYEAAEKAHPNNVWFKLDASQNNLKKGMEEMGKLLHTGFSNFGILLLGLKDISEIYKVRVAAAECGVPFGTAIPFGIMVEYPAMALSYDSVSNAGASFAVMDIDALSKRIMCSEKNYDAIPEPVMKIVAKSIEHFKERKIHVSAGGHMLDNSAVLKDLLSHGIDSIVAHQHNAERIKLKTAYAEKTFELDFLKSKMKRHIKS